MCLCRSVHLSDSHHQIDHCGWPGHSLRWCECDEFLFSARRDSRTAQHSISEWLLDCARWRYHDPSQRWPDAEPMHVPELHERTTRRRDWQRHSAHASQSHRHAILQLSRDRRRCHLHRLCFLDALSHQHSLRFLHRRDWLWWRNQHDCYEHVPIMHLLRVSIWN